MLQQTRVEAVKGYYARFLQKLPNVEHLANAEDDLLHKLWEGLGYYTRVKNLKKAAACIMEQHDGKFPTDYPSVLALPGIGEYTAGAVCSIAFGLKTPAVDGNVLRILTRVNGIRRDITDPKLKAEFREALRAVYPAGKCGDFTQALMELGATVCLPNGVPKCNVCPWYSFCCTAECGCWQEIPVKKSAKPRRIEERTVIVAVCNGRVALHRRPPKGLLAGLWEFPNVLAGETLPITGDVFGKPLNAKHVFSHIEWHMTGIFLNVSEPAAEWEWVDISALQKEYALPSAFKAFLEKL
jgi:A/G-specific adenine glycosylase